jgi:hypothetical protein
VTTATDRAERAADCPGGAYLSLPPQEREPEAWYIIAEGPELGPYGSAIEACLHGLELGLSGKWEAV